MDYAINASTSLPRTLRSKPRLGFLGVGWIGGHRLKSMVDSDLVDVAAIADPSAQNQTNALAIAPQAQCVQGLEALLALDLDGIVIATPSAQHAAQAHAALQAGVPVFCQKPLALDADETRRVIRAARTADRLLGVDLSYRHLRGLDQMRRLLAEGAFGKVFAVDLIFHNAYGPDKPWYYDKTAAGGGCVIDLGTHLVDLMFWLLDNPGISHVSSTLFAGGAPVDGRAVIEDFASVHMTLDGGIDARLACSWNLSAGREAIIQAVFYGTEGGCCVRNVGGSFFNFQTERYQGTQREVLTPPSDDWWGAAAVHWARTLGNSARYDAQIEGLIRVAEVLDAVYG
jgi:predicted dehydrogenase